MTGHDRHPGDRLAALVDGRLEQPERDRILAHLDGCARCRADYEAQLALKGLLGKLDRPGPTSDLQARLARLPFDPDAVPNGGERHRRASGPVRVVIVGVAACSVVMITLGTAYVLGGPDAAQPVVPAVNQFATDHTAVTGDIPLVQPPLSELMIVRTPFLPRTATAVVRTGPGP